MIVKPCGLEADEAGRDRIDPENMPPPGVEVCQMTHLTSADAAIVGLAEIQRRIDELEIYEAQLTALYDRAQAAFLSAAGAFHRGDRELGVAMNAWDGAAETTAAERRRVRRALRALRLERWRATDPAAFRASGEAPAAIEDFR